MGCRKLRVEAGTKYSWAFGLEGIACRKKLCVQRIKFNSAWTEFSALLGGGGTIKFSWRDGQEENLEELCSCKVRMVSCIFEGRGEDSLNSKAIFPSCQLFIIPR